MPTNAMITHTDHSAYPFAEETLYTATADSWLALKTDSCYRNLTRILPALTGIKCPSR